MRHSQGPFLFHLQSPFFFLSEREKKRLEFSLIGKRLGHHPGLECTRARAFHRPASQPSPGEAAMLWQERNLHRYPVWCGQSPQHAQGCIVCDLAESAKMRKICSHRQVGAYSFTPGPATSHSGSHSQGGETRSLSPLFGP